MNKPMPSPLLPGQTAPEALSVSELTAQIKTLLEQGFSRVKVSGEVSRLTARAGGHIYFTIKDANAALSAVIWKSTALRLSVPPEEGKQYIFHGHISLYPPQGRYQLVVSRLEEEGGGALAAEFERRKKDFAAHGWFASEHKRELPALPKHIGIVTSESAAALQDVRKVLSTRPGWLHLSLAPTPVQGNMAPDGIAKALEDLQAMQDRPDVILLVRGGGSPEDLWCFNDEKVVRSIFECPIPIITGIGHDIDTSLADFAADAYAATPSNAAEIACPASEALRRQMPRIALLRQLVEHRVSKARQFTQRADTALSHRWQTWRDEKRMHVERMQHLLTTNSRQIQQSRRGQLRLLEKRLLPLEPGQRLRLRQRRLDETMQRLHSAAKSQVQQAMRKLDHRRQSLRLLQGSLVEQPRRMIDLQNGKLATLGPQSVLQRGYTLAMTKEGKLLHSVRGLKKNDALHIRFHDGTADTQVIDTHPEPKKT